MIQSQNSSITYVVTNSMEYIFPFKFFKPEDLSVFLDSTALVKDIDWSVEHKNDYSDGARIVLKENSNTQGAAGKKLTIQRVLAYTQDASLPTNGKLDSRTLETALDKLTMLAQKLLEKSGRSLVLPPGTGSTDIDALFEAISKVKVEVESALTSASEATTAAQQAEKILAEIEKIKNVVKEALEKSAGYHLGAFFPYPGATPPAGAYLLNGQTITNCRGLYPRFWEWVQNAGVRLIDDATYDSEIASAGVCGGFVVDTSAGSVRLPNDVNGTLWGANADTIGQSLAAGLPNITAEWQAVHGTYAGGNDYFNVDGAIEYIASENSRNGKDVRGNTSSTAAGDRLGFDASRSNSTYGNSDTVQPPAIRVSWCIQVFNAATALSEQESAQLASLMQTKAQTDLANITDAGKNAIRKESAMRVWESGEQSITNSTLYQLTHDLNLSDAEIHKARARILLRCVTPEHGYQVGDYVYMPSDNVINQETWESQPVVRSNSVVWCKSSGNFWINPVSGGGGYINANNANWKMIFQIFY